MGQDKLDDVQHHQEAVESNGSPRKPRPKRNREEDDDEDSDQPAVEGVKAHEVVGILESGVDGFLVIVGVCDREDPGGDEIELENVPGEDEDPHHRIDLSKDVRHGQPPVDSATEPVFNQATRVAGETPSPGIKNNRSNQGRYEP